MGRCTHGLLTTQDTYEPSLQVLFGTLLAIIHFTLALLQLMHVEPKEKDDNSTNMPLNHRISGRCFGGTTILVLSFTVQLTGNQWLLLAMGLTTFGTLIEEYGGAHFVQGA